MARDRSNPDRISVAVKVKALASAVELAEGRADADLVERARRVVQHTDRRLAFSGDATVVALAGATGSGKSSTFNALSGTQLAEPGVKRPTTSKAMAAFWGDEVPEDLLDWLQVPRRHLVQGGRADLDGLVLLDLPDHDSTERSHRDEVDRLVQLVDMFIWVVDPQKYADAALHERYLKPLADHAEVMVVVLNQIDRLTPDEQKQALSDLRRLLDSEGLEKARVCAISAATGQGVDELRSQLAQAIGEKQMAARRLEADVSSVAKQLTADIGRVEVGEVSEDRARDLTRALSDAAGVPIVVDAVAKAMRRRGTLATGWPAISWIKGLRPDPLKRLRLDSVKIGRKTELEPARVQRTSLPGLNGVQKARVDSAVRALADDAAEGLPRGWADAVRAASREHERILPDELDRAVATTDLAVDRGHVWWRIFQFLQWLLIAAVLVGLGWLGARVAASYFGFPPLSLGPRWHGFATPTLLVIGGVAAGILLAAISRIFVELAARSKARRARHVLDKAVAQVAKERVVAPVNSELRRYERARDTIVRAI